MIVLALLILLALGLILVAPSAFRMFNRTVDYLWARPKLVLTLSAVYLIGAAAYSVAWRFV